MTDISLGRVYLGTVLDVGFTFSSSGEPLDLTDYSLTWYAAPYGELTPTISQVMTIDDAPAGKARLHVALGEDLTPGTWRYEVRGTKNTETYLFAAGTITLVRGLV